MTTATDRRCRMLSAKMAPGRRGSVLELRGGPRREGQREIGGSIVWIV